MSGFPKDGDFTKRDQLFKYIEKQLVKHWDKIQGLFCDGDGRPIKPIHVRESEWNVEEHWVANWTGPVLSCTASFDTHEDFVHHVLNCGGREFEAEKQVCAAMLLGD